MSKELVEALERAERKLTAYVGVCKGDKELTGAVLPMVRAALAAHREAVPSYVHAVPDHCDRIVWRTHYYGLPPRALPPAPAGGADWWCARCQKHVDPVHVTYEETHDERSGGCGNAVVPAGGA